LSFDFLQEPGLEATLNVVSKLKLLTPTHLRKPREVRAEKERAEGTPKRPASSLGPPSQQGAFLTEGDAAVCKNFYASKYF